MKKIIFLSLLVLPLLFSCEKESEDVSRTIFYVDLALKGDETVVVEVNTSYVEPGYTATENGVDVSANVEISGSVDVATPGAYTLVYSVLNTDGYPKTATRLVLVVPAGLSTVDLTGVYTGQRATKPSTLSATNISKVSTGVFLADDMFGGYYNKVANYGLAYRLKTYFVLNGDNTITGLWTDSPWGPWDILNGVYNPATNVITHRVQQGTFGFDVTLTKE